MIRPQIMSAKTYLIIFLIISLGVYVGFNAKLYNDAENILQQTQERTTQMAESELRNAIQTALSIAQRKLKELSQWEEIHQQLSQPSYYIYWHNERLKESPYWSPFFDQLELYNADGLPIQKKFASQYEYQLPDKVSGKKMYFVNTEGHLDLVGYEPVYLNTIKQAEGYIGLTLDFFPLLIQNYPFIYLDKTSLKIKKTHQSTEISILDIGKYIEFKAVKNPVNDFLWELIQKFINQVVVFGLLLAGLFTLFFKFSTLNPLQSLVRYLKKLEENPTKIIAPDQKTFCFLEFEELKNSLASYNQELIHAQNEIEHQRQTAYEQSRVDALSKILNRRAFDDRLDDLFLHYHLDPRSIGFMLFDCDFFKAINDTYGHEIGDAVIRITASTFKNSLPSTCADVYRIGGDEFACIIESKDKNEVLEIAENCFQAIKSYDFNHLGIKEKISYSIGISFIDSENANDLSLMHKQADIALYKSKRSLHQKIQVYQYDEQTTGQTLVSNEHVTAIVESLHTGRNIQMHLQPVYNQQYQIDYYESLIRIGFKETLIYPNEIFGVVKHRNLETELDKQVILNIHDMLQKRIIPLNAGVSINLSAATLLNEDLIPLFSPLIPYLDNYKITIEIVEDTLITYLHIATEKLDALRKKGFTIALDDFGSGYSSIRYLAHMPVDIIKFDMSLTHALLSDKKTKKIIQTTAKMILDAGYQLVLEGIETEKQLAAAKVAGATHYQGYLLGKPVYLDQPAMDDSTASFTQSKITAL